jgi:hypothetical protein
MTNKSPLAPPAHLLPLLVSTRHFKIDRPLVDSSISSPTVNSYWNTSFGSASALPNPYKVNTAAGFPLDSGNSIHSALTN